MFSARRLRGLVTGLLLSVTLTLTLAVGEAHALSNCYSGSGTYQGYPYWGDVCYDGIGHQRAEAFTVVGQRLLGPCVGQDVWSNAISWSGSPIAWGHRITC